LKRHGFIISEPIFDTMIGAWILGNVHGARYGLKDLTARKLGFRMTEFAEVVGKRKSFSDVPIREATLYAAADADMTKRLYHIEQESLERFPTLNETFTLEMPCVSVLQYMEEVGALVDRKYLESLKKPLKKQMDGFESMVTQIFGNINIRSNEQLLERINKHIFPKKVDSTEFEVLMGIKDDYPVIDSYLKYAKRQKMYSVYVDGMIKLLDDNNRVHTEYKQNKKTGRLSSSNPNLQNIPTKKDDPTNPAYEYTHDLPLIRKAFIAKPGYKIVSIDYSQLEVRLTAHRAQEETWIDAYNKDVDIHKATAAAVFGIPLSKVTKDQRFRAKAVNFGLLYGMSEYGLARRIKVTVPEAKEFIDRYFENLPMVRKYIEDRKQEVIDQKYVETEIGRRLYFKYDLENAKSLPSAQREAINMPIQGQAADIVKKAMVEVHSLLQFYKSDMILQVHDELDFEMAEDEMEILIPQIQDIMSNVYKISVPLKTDVEYGDNWESLKDWTKR
ncbi:MAG: DNA polymerase I, partial [Richelia sp. SL_2_1]|nr:DNA polymerase I [Richelia sp. SL_2_1]